MSKLRHFGRKIAFMFWIVEQRSFFFLLFHFGFVFYFSIHRDGSYYLLFGIQLAWFFTIEVDFSFFFFSFSVCFFVFSTSFYSFSELISNGFVHCFDFGRMCVLRCVNPNIIAFWFEMCFVTEIRNWNSNWIELSINDQWAVSLLCISFLTFFVRVQCATCIKFC